ncbi:hypothetical protein J2S80_000181 [Pseudoxanthomonas mexicana]|nr:hypothetical protein [Pseudoxanthomonas mexicana]
MGAMPFLHHLRRIRKPPPPAYPEKPPLAR